MTLRSLKKIVCLTEESVETLYLLNKQELIAGVSGFVKRPIQATKLKKVSLFTSANYQQIEEIQPDLILGHSDIQKDIARDLIEQGFNVFIANHRSIQETLNYIQLLGNIVDARNEAAKLVANLEAEIEQAQKIARELPQKPKVYFEEWDDPAISAIRWVSEAIEVCGGENIFAKNAVGTLAKDRFVQFEDVLSANPDIIFACWCGKKAKLAQIRQRNSWNKINAIKNNQLFELAPEIFLQPGPAYLTDGLKIFSNYFKKWSDHDT